MSIDPNPYAPPAVFASVDEAEKGLSRRRTRWAMAAAVICLVGAIPAAGYSIVDIESIIGSGPALLLVAIALYFLAVPAPLRPLRWISGAISVIVVFVFLLININEWSPRRAEDPVNSILCVAAVLLQTGWIPLVQVRNAVRELSLLDESDVT